MRLVINNLFKLNIDVNVCMLHTTDAAVNSIWADILIFHFMNSKISWIVMAVLGVAIKVFSCFPEAVEHYYSNGIFPVISTTQRFIFGWMPTSIGDIFYLSAFLLLVRNAVLFFKAVLAGRMTKQGMQRSLKRVALICLIVYVAFNILWGLNYNRMPMEQLMGLQVQEYSTRNLQAVVSKLISRLNGFDSTERLNRFRNSGKETIIRKAVDTYVEIAKQYPALRYTYPSVKPSLYSYAGNYLGFTGYYNPFSGEAQANNTVPEFVQPFTTCHEIGHQLGFAKENEANFAGFLAARASPHQAFQYSAYFDMYVYAIRELYERDSSGARRMQRQLNLAVRLDLITVRQFYHRYDSPLSPMIWTLYGRFLKANEQPEGLRSYNEVVAMLLAFYKKYGFI